MVEFVRRKGAECSPRRVVDLFCGTGLFALSLAGAGRTVQGMEASSSAISLARRNAARNEIEGVEFIRGSAENSTAILQGSAPDLAVVDPPRSGLSPVARRELISLHPGRVLYVSCNPSTLARDLDALNAGGYEVCDARGFDLFPQTSHVECIVELQCR